MGELRLAMLAHPDRSRIILDSPAKTRPEIRAAIESRVGLTIDNLDELQRVDEILKEYETIPTDLGLIGIRLNPQIGGGAILTHSVSKLWSKFGTPVTELREEVIQAYIDRPWLNLMHVHAGSQTYTMDQLAEAIRVVVDVANEINQRIALQYPHDKHRQHQITTFDIGGGLPVNFKTEENEITFAQWSSVLQAKVPELFSGKYNVITEFGRRLLAKQGVVVSRIEYVKEAGGRRVILQHVGADVAVRTVYRPEAWPLRVSCFGANGQEMIPGDEPYEYTKTTKPLLPADVAGPCCIDDVLAPSQRPLPDVSEGDYIMLHDTGAYFHSAYSYYNCRQAPALYCFEENTNTSNKITNDDFTINFEQIRPASTVEETIDFFYTKK